MNESEIVEAIASWIENQSPEYAELASGVRAGAWRGSAAPVIDDPDSGGE